MPEYPYEEKNEVESDRDFLQFFLPQLDLPVIQESQAEEQTGQSSSQVSRVPVLCRERGVVLLMECLLTMCWI